MCSVVYCELIIVYYCIIIVAEISLCTTNNSNSMIVLMFVVCSYSVVYCELIIVFLYISYYIICKLRWIEIGEMLRVLRYHCISLYYCTGTEEEWPWLITRV